MVRFVLIFVCTALYIQLHQVTGNIAEDIEANIAADYLLENVPSFKKNFKKEVEKRGMSYKKAKRELGKRAIKTMKFVIEVKGDDLL